jgi:hypothetical protein
VAADRSRLVRCRCVGGLRSAASASTATPQPSSQSNALR